MQRGDANTPEVDTHTRIILGRYSDKQNIGIVNTTPNVLTSRYLSKVMDPSEFKGKTILEIGAGCSQYIPVFMSHGCKRYYANDIVPERLEVVRIDDPRFVTLPGDIRFVKIPEPPDIIFATLTMMQLQPMFEEIAEKISAMLTPGGLFVTMDPNYICPLSIYRRFTVKGANPHKLYSPFTYASVFRRNGFEIEKLVPFTPPLPSTTGNWLLGTAFWMRARKK